MYCAFCHVRYVEEDYPDLKCPVCSLTAELQHFKDTADAYDDERKSLKAELAEARKDSDRLDWLSNCDTVKVWKKQNSGDPSIWFCHIDGDIRAAIDAGKHR
jgi:hypothetical protein